MKSFVFLSLAVSALASFDDAVMDLMEESPMDDHSTLLGGVHPDMRVKGTEKLSDACESVEGKIACRLELDHKGTKATIETLRHDFGGEQDAVSVRMLDHTGRVLYEKHEATAPQEWKDAEEKEYQQFAPVHEEFKGHAQNMLKSLPELEEYHAQEAIEELIEMRRCIGNGECSGGIGRNSGNYKAFVNRYKIGVNAAFWGFAVHFGWEHSAVFAAGFACTSFYCNRMWSKNHCNMGTCFGGGQGLKYSKGHAWAKARVNKFKCGNQGPCQKPWCRTPLIKTVDCGGIYFLSGKVCNSWSWMQGMQVKMNWQSYCHNKPSVRTKAPDCGYRRIYWLGGRGGGAGDHHCTFSQHENW